MSKIANEIYKYMNSIDNKKGYSEFINIWDSEEAKDTIRSYAKKEKVKPNITKNSKYVQGGETWGIVVVDEETLLAVYADMTSDVRPLPLNKWKNWVKTMTKTYNIDESNYDNILDKIDKYLK